MSTDSGYASAARQQAHQILSQAPYTNSQSSPPRPFAGVLHAIGRFFDVVFGPIGHWVEHHLFSPIGHGYSDIFGGWSEVVGIVLAVGAGAIIAILLVRRRSRISPRASRTHSGAKAVDPADLESEADRRAAAGDFATAVRMRFQAGLLRLEAAGLVTNHVVRTGAEVSEHIGSPTFDLLVRRHEAVTYAGDRASADDVEQARTSWPRVPDEALSHRVLTRSGSS